MLTIFETRKSDHPEGNRWTVYDTRTGEIAEVRGLAPVDLPLDDADELANHLNYVASQQLADA